MNDNPEPKTLLVLPTSSSTPVGYTMLLALAVCSMSFAMGLPNKSVDSLRTKIQNFEKQDSFQDTDKAYINTLNALAKQLFKHNNDSLLLLATKSLKLSQKTSYVEGEINALNLLGEYYADRGSSEQAMRYLDIALQLAKKNSCRALELQVRNTRAYAYIYWDKHALSLKEALQARELAIALDDNKTLGQIEHNIGLLYTGEQNHEQALKHFSIERDIMLALNDDSTMAKALANMAHNNINLRHFDDAQLQINQAIDIFEADNNFDWLGYSLGVKGKLFLVQEDFKTALHWYQQSAYIYKNKIDDQRAEILIKQGYSDVYVGLNKIDFAEAHALEALQISNNLNDTYGIQNALRTLYRVYKLKKEHKKALLYHEQFQEGYNTFLKSLAHNNVELVKAELDFENERKTILRASEMDLAKKQVLIVASVVALLIALLVLIMIFRNHQTQKTLNLELQKKKEELEKSEANLLALDETKNKLFSIIGHDLKGPINAFQGLIQMFKHGEVDRREFLSFIPKMSTDINQIAFTLQNLLAWGKTQLKGEVITPKEVAIDKIVTENFKLLAEIARSKSIQLINHIPDNTYIWSDLDQINIVIRNLISNALKFTPKNGKITVLSKTHKNHLEIEIRDNGIGMNEATKKQLFEMDKHNKATYGTNNEKGSGLGLVLCKEMLTKNGGSISVESNLNFGTSFFLTIPRKQKRLEKAS